MNTDEFLKKAETDEKLANEFKAAAAADHLDDFFRSHQIDTTKEDFLKHIKNLKDMNAELSDSELEAVAGGKPSMLFTAKIFCG